MEPGFYDRVDRYLRGDMTPEQMHEFESELAQNPEYQEEVKRQRMTEKVVYQAEAWKLRDEIDLHFKVRKNKRGKGWWLGGGLSLVLILLVLIFWMFSSDYISHPMTRSQGDNEHPLVDSIPHPEIDSLFAPHPHHSHPIPAGKPAELYTVPMDSLWLSRSRKQKHQVQAVRDLRHPNPKNHDGPCPELHIHVHMVLACENEATGRVEVDVDGGEAPYEYALNNDHEYSNVAEFNQLYSGDYNIYVRDHHGCGASQKIHLNEHHCKERTYTFIPSQGGWEYDSRSHEVTLEIFDSKGDLVFEAQKKNPSWNGKTLQGKWAKKGTYLFLVYQHGQLVDRGGVLLK